MKSAGNLRASSKQALKTHFNFEADLISARRQKGQPYSEVQSKVDLKDLLLPVPENHYLVSVTGDSMIDEDIHEGDILIVNYKDEPTDGNIVIASVNGDLLVKRLKEIDGEIYLFSANQKFLPIKIMPFWEFKIQGVVRHIVRNM